MAEDNKQQLLALLKEPGNDMCADCRMKGVEWASCNLGVFLCTTCAAVHRSLGAHVCKVKSIKLDNWDNQQVQVMKSLGNLKVNEKYEANVPAFYRRPKQSDPTAVLEQWIRGKYEREEFVAGHESRQSAYTCSEKKGWLLKRGRDKNEFLRRQFILSQHEDVLKYYIKETDRNPRGVIQLSKLNVAFCGEKVGNLNGLQLTFLGQADNTRCLFLYAESGQDIVEWYNAIRGCKYNLLKVAHPGADDAELLASLTHDFLHEGWMFKSGPKSSDAYRRRWFTLEERKLMYFTHPLDATPKGEIYLGHLDDKYSIREGFPPGQKGVGFGYTLKTPNRTYCLAADTADDRSSWIDAIRSVLETPLTPRQRGQFRYLAHRS